jgi:Na+-driven multidrug efflux pump
VGISSALTTVAGAAYGAKDMYKLQAAWSYALKIGVGLATALLVLTYLFAPYIAMMFTWSEQAVIMTDDLIRFLRIAFLGHPGFAVVIIAGSLFYERRLKK